MKKYYTLLLLSFFSITIYGQTPTPPGDIYNLDLRNWLRNNWYNGFHSSVGYSSAREEMYSYIDNEGGQVYCVYTGYHQNSAFTSFLNPINCEHSIPQSFFNSSEPMKSDIHHLFPTHQDINTVRSNHPFDDINDTFTDTWYTQSTTGITQTNSIPSANIDEYSEYRSNTRFEPREDHKGNVARAIFYFYTMYPTQAGNIEDLADLETIYEWHQLDPVDAQEIIRNEKTYQVQGNYNPYIYSPELVAEAWGFIDNISVDERERNSLKIYPNPAEDYLFIFGAANTQFRILSANGQLCASGNLKNNKIDISNLESGIYIIQSVSENNLKTLKFIKK